MLIIGWDMHTRNQQVAMLDTETVELVKRRLEHENGEARKFYASLPRGAPLQFHCDGLHVVSIGNRQANIGNSTGGPLPW